MTTAHQERSYHLGEDDWLSPVDKNLALVAEIVEQDRDFLQAQLKIDANSFDVLAIRASLVVSEYQVRELIDTEFVLEMMQIMAESDQTGTGTEPELVRKMSPALQNLQWRNGNAPQLD